MLLERVLRTIGQYEMLRRGDRVGVAVSGGADSVCLAAVLRELSGRLGIELHLLHLNHGLRGAESDGDAEFVASLAAEWGLPCTLGRVDLLGVEGNLEQEARRARQRFFTQSARTLGLRRVATGHTLSDQAETVLFRLVRGTGPAGLIGILPVTAEGLIRPLLEIESADVRLWLGSRGLWWREDSSNTDPRFRRNVLRRRILPELEERVRPGSARALARLATLAAVEEDYWRGAAEAALAGTLSGESQLVFQTTELAKLHPALARRVLRLGLERVAGSLRGFTQQHIERLYHLAAADRGHGRVVLPRVFAERSFEWLKLSTGRPEARPEWSLPAGGPGLLPGVGLSLEVVDEPDGCRVPANGAECLYNVGRDWLDFDLLTFPLLVRNMRAGDTYQPVGSERPRKLAELFQSARIPSWNRLGWPIILSADRIVWSRRFGAAAWAAAGPGARRALRVVEV